MANIGFRWLDILEKEFDKAFVDLDLTIGELDSEEPDVVFNVRQKLCTLSSCFAQLTHKAQTIFQNSAKIEAELIHMRAELVESKAKKETLEHELHNFLLQLHSSQLSQLPDNFGNKKHEQFIKPDISLIKKKLEAEIRQSPHRISKDSEEFKLCSSSVETAQYKSENAQLLLENAALRESILALNSEVYGAKLAAKYLDKELAGRIQQLQLLGREMRVDVRDKLWRQLESEILLQRHKTVVRACRRNSMLNNSEKANHKPDTDSIPEKTEHFGDIRTVVVKRKPGQGLGISITGGREHGVPILISELEPNGPAAVSEQLFIGDAILFVNDRDLRQSCHREAVGILQQQTGDCTLQVQYIAADDSDNSLEEEGYNFRFFDDEVCTLSNPNSLNSRVDSKEIVNTPTAPRTPESTSTSRISRNASPEIVNINQSIPTLPLPESLNFQQDTFNHNLNNFNNVLVKEEKDDNATNNVNLNIESADHVNKNFTSTAYETTNDVVLIDNTTNNIIKLENFKKVDMMFSTDDNFKCSLNSLNSENLSSPMQTSTDVYSEILSTDIASNDSQSPKNLQISQLKAHNNVNFKYDQTASMEKTKEVSTLQKKATYASNDSLSNMKSDQSLLNSEESCGSSPLHKTNRDYKKVRKHRKKYFGVKTLQSIFSKNGGYSDISSTASELGDDPQIEVDEKTTPETRPITKPTYSIPSEYPETSAQFEENIHNFLSDIFVKNFTQAEAAGVSKILNKAAITKKHFSLHGHHLRVGKALRLCPNEDLSAVENEQKKEKLLARYVYNANSIHADGVGDPDFGTPV